ncbi:hypothetical protein [Scytonema sp. PRP1]|uniref:hypothetical protein n=1 Tax=Scytonema sp. PRP1 TaxID=3120513 RepID=UPI002FD4B01D
MLYNLYTQNFTTWVILHVLRHTPKNYKSAAGLAFPKPAQADQTSEEKNGRSGRPLLLQSLLGLLA